MKRISTAAAALAVFSVIALPSSAAFAATGQDVAGLSSATTVLAGTGAVLLLTVGGMLLGRSVNRRIGAALDRRRLSKILQSVSSDVLEDFMLPGAYGGLTHIDHGVLTKSGIFCIRTKYCDGTVSGGTSDPQWTNVDGNRRRKFLNPVIQNQGRARALQNFAPDVPVVNLVVFRDTVRFTTPMGENVVHLRDLGQYLASYPFQPCDGGHLDIVWKALQSAALTDDATRKDFRAQLSFS